MGDTSYPLPEQLLTLLDTKLPEIPFWIGRSVKNDKAIILPKGGKLLFGGQAKIGKTWLMLEIIRSLITGEPTFDHPKLTVHKPKKVLFIEQELGKYGLQDRTAPVFKSIPRDILHERLFYVSRDPSYNLTEPEAKRKLLYVLDKLEPDVLIMDPISKCHHYDENDATGMAKMFAFMDKMLLDHQERGMSFVFSHHFGKPSDRDPLSPYNFRGSSKFPDDPDALIMVQEKDRLDTPHKAWNVKVRFVTRHGQGLSDALLSVNRDGDLRVRYETDEDVGTKFEGGLLRPPKAGETHPDLRKKKDTGPIVAPKSLFKPG
jgi:hypothetical protein